jgi:transcriptional regulator with XRE-family HTH domain
MASVAEILVQGRERLRWTQVELAFRAGVSASTVSRAEQEKGSLNINSLRRLAVAIGYDADALAEVARNPDAPHPEAWLAEPARPMATPSQPVYLSMEPMTRVVRVPHYGGVSAVRADLREHGWDDYSDVPDLGVDFTVRVEGQCMEPRYEDGERVGCSVRRWQREGFIWGRDYWIRFTDGQTTLKRVQADPRDGEKFLCVPINPATQPFARPKIDVDKAARVLLVLSR